MAGEAGIASPLPENAETLQARPAAQGLATSLAQQPASTQAPAATVVQAPQAHVAGRHIPAPAAEPAEAAYQPVSAPDIKIPAVSLPAETASSAKTQAPADTAVQAPQAHDAARNVPATAAEPAETAYRPVTAPDIQTPAASLPAEPAAALPSVPVAAVQSIAPAQTSGAMHQTKAAKPAAGSTRTAASASTASVQSNVTGFDVDLDGDAIAPARLESAPMANALGDSKPVPGPAAQAAQAAPVVGEPQPAHQHAAAAESGQQAKVEATPSSSRSGKPVSSDFYAAVTSAPVSPVVSDASAVAAPVAAQPETQAAVASIGPAQPVAASTDVAPAQTGAAPAPAVQLAQAVTSLHAGADGSSHVTIKLDPAELGQVQVRITRGQDGTARVNVAVERPETLASLQGDLGHLHAALDRAGLPEQRSVTLHLAGSDQAGGQSLGSGAGGMSQGGFQQGARQERQPSSSFVPDFSAGAQMPAVAREAASLSRPAPASGVNITA